MTLRTEPTTSSTCVTCALNKDVTPTPALKGTICTQKEEFIPAKKITYLFTYCDSVDIGSPAHKAIAALALTGIAHIVFKGGDKLLTKVTGNKKIEFCLGLAKIIPVIVIGHDMIKSAYKA